MRKPAGRKPFIIGVTGSFGSGKSTVAGMFREKGCAVIDADKLAHAAVSRNPLIRRRVLEAFGPSIRDTHAGVSRKKLALLVFGDERKRKRLNSLVHPCVKKMIMNKIARSRKNCIVCDIPLLFEAGLRSLADIVVVVSVKPSVQIARIKKKLRLTEPQIRARINAQMPLKKKERLADFVIDNNGSLLATEKKMESIWKRVRLMKKKR